MILKKKKCLYSRRPKNNTSQNSNSWNNIFFVFSGLAFQRPTSRSSQSICDQSQRFASNGYQRKSRPLPSPSVGIKTHIRQRKLRFQATQSHIWKVSQDPSY